jgi:hypothetical protein
MAETVTLAVATKADRCGLAQQPTFVLLPFNGASTKFSAVSEDAGLSAIPEVGTSA